TFSVTKLGAMTHVPDNDAIAFNPATGLLYHTSAASSSRNTPADVNYPDNQYMETIPVASGSTTPTAVFNANSPQFGLAAPAPTWVLPATRRTDAQNTDEFKNMFGDGEYHGARDLTWSLGDKAFLVADETGLYRLAADGSTSTFIGDPGFGEGGLAGIAFLNVDGRRV